MGPDVSLACLISFDRLWPTMSLRRNDVLTPKHSSLQLLIFASLAMIVLSSMIQPTKAAPGLSDRRIYPNWDRRFDHRIRLAKKNFEDDIIARPETRARYSEAEDQADIDQAIKLLLEKYLVSKNDVSKRDYIRLM